MDNFKFAIGALVRIACSNEAGVVAGVALYEGGGQPQYFVRYKSNDHGQAVEKWWGESALESAVPEDDEVLSESGKAKTG